MRFKMQLRALVAAALVSGLSAAPSAAATIALVIAIDTSGSIDQTEYELQRQAYANFFDDHSASFAGKDVSVTVLYWAGAGVQQQVVPWTTLNSAADAQGFADAILATSRPDISGPSAAQTGVARALDAAAALFAQGQHFCSQLSCVIDISGDGTENLDTTVTVSLDVVDINIPGFGVSPFNVLVNWGEALTAANNAIAAGILINALPIIPVPVPGDPNFAVETQDSSPAIGFFPPPVVEINGQPVDISAEWAAALQGLGYDDVTLLELFYSRIIGSPDARIPFMVVANGFTAQELGDKISQKLGQELGIPVPEPSTLLLGSIGLSAFGMSRRRRSLTR
jgi:hypothetical protein